MTFELRAISGTPNHLIVQRSSTVSAATLVAEIVRMPDGFTIYRMDVTGVLGSGYETPAAALKFFEDWVRDTDPALEGVGF
ncbi:hypothetical protein BH10ACT7_BH10ACT7_25780 [soil metagenome]